MTDNREDLSGLFKSWMQSKDLKQVNDASKKLKAKGIDIDSLSHEDISKYINNLIKKEPIYNSKLTAASITADNVHTIPEVSKFKSILEGIGKNNPTAEQANLFQKEINNPYFMAAVGSLTKGGNFSQEELARREEVLNNVREQFKKDYEDGIKNNISETKDNISTNSPTYKKITDEGVSSPKAPWMPKENFIKQEKPGVIRALGDVLKGTWKDLKENRKASLPNNAEDMMKARALGFEVRENKLSKLSSKLTGAASPMYEVVNQLDGSAIDITGLSKLSDSEINTWKQGHIYDYAKDKDPSELSDIFTHQRYSSKENDWYAQQHNYNKEQLQIVETLKKNNLSDEQLQNLSSNEEELKARIKAYDAGSVHNSQISNDPMGNMFDYPYRGVSTKENLEKYARAVDSAAESMFGQSATALSGGRYRGIFNHRFGHGQTGGFGLGYSASMKATRGKHFSRFAQTFTPRGYLRSTTQGFLEGAAILNKHQRIQFKMSGYGGRLMLGLGSALPAASVLKDVYSQEDPSEVLKDYVSNVGFMNGWRRGSALGGALTKPNSVSRFIGMGLGGASGALLGSAIWAGAVDLGVDLTSNQSKIRSVARSLTSKELYAQGEMTNKALTMRQAGLQKLARSGLNDRGLLLGNEASVLAGAM